MTTSIITIIVAAILCTISLPAAAEIGSVRITGTRYVAGEAERISCSA